MLLTLARLMIATLLLAIGAGWVAGQDRNLTLDFSQVRGTLATAPQECIGAGRANEGLRADWQRQLAYIKQECGFKYIRFHGLLTDDMGVYQEDRQGRPHYNWQYVDELFDFLQSIGMKPFVELSFMPNALASGNKTIFWWRGNITPPKDMQKWADLIRNLTQHLTERYGQREVATWYFEVWNEPNLDGFFSGTQDDYLRLYAATARAIKSVSEAYRVGGPATAGAAWTPEFLKYCQANRVPVDFVSTHTYGVSQGFVDEFGASGTVLDPNPRSIVQDVARVRAEIQASFRPNLELHFTEWSSSYTPADPLHDSYHEAAYILQKLKQSEGLAQSMSYWVFTDIFEEAGPRFTPFHGGFGLLNTQGIRKPAFFAYQFLKRLGTNELQNQDAQSWATKTAGGAVQILAWDFTHTHPGPSVNNQVYYQQDLPAKAKGRLNISLTKVPPGRYRLEVFQVGYQVNDAYTAYLKLGAPSQLTKAQVQSLNATADGTPRQSATVTVGPAQTFSTSLALRENDVFLITLNRRSSN